jgi:hypothetical protein
MRLNRLFALSKQPSAPFRQLVTPPKPSRAPARRRAVVVLGRLFRSDFFLAAGRPVSNPIIQRALRRMAKDQEPASERLNAAY